MYFIDLPVMIHFEDTSLAHGAVMSTIWLDATALWTLEDNFTLAQSQHLNVFLCGIAELYSTRIAKHCLQMTRYGQEYTTIEQYHVYVSVVEVWTWQEHNFHDNKLGVGDEEPCQHGTYYTTDILE